MCNRQWIAPPTIDGNVQQLGIVRIEIGSNIEETILIGPYVLIEIKIVVYQILPPVNPSMDINVVVVSDTQCPGFISFGWFLNIKL
jgi:hypothetical protein